MSEEVGRDCVNELNVMKSKAADNRTLVFANKLFLSIATFQFVRNLLDFPGRFTRLILIGSV